jgi:GntR family transcriptional regulator
VILRSSQAPSVDHRPVYIQVAETLRARILAGYYGDRLDGELPLAREWGVSRRTIQQALDILVRDDLLVRQQGAGTFINRRGVERRYRAITSITDGIVGQGLKASYRILASGAQPPTPEAREFFALAVDEMVYRHRRLVLADDQPVAVANTLLNLKLLEGLELSHLDEGLYRLLRRRYGRTIVSAEDSYRPTLADLETADHLDLAKGAPIFLAVRRAVDQTGAPLELSEISMIPASLEISIRQTGADWLGREPAQPAEPWRYRVGFGDFRR